MLLSFRPLDPRKDRSDIEHITRSSGFFEEDEVELSLEYFDHCAENGTDAEHEFLIAESDGEMAGYSNFGKASYSGLSYYLHWIAVDNAYRGRGLGKLILRETEKLILSRGGRKVFAETSSKEQYIATQRFYESAGYTVEGRLKDFYLIGDDQLIFSRLI